MTSIALDPPATSRSRFQGLLQIVRFNWPFYVVGGVTVLLAFFAAAAFPMPFVARIVLSACAVPAAYWMIASLVVSDWVYDRSPLRSWTWVKDLAGQPRRWVNLHAGHESRIVHLNPLTECRTISFRHSG